MTSLDVSVTGQRVGWNVVENKEDAQVALHHVNPK